MIKIPKLSAIIKCHNEELFLRECITSIKPFVDEIIFVNSHSTDSSVQIAEALGINVIHFDGHPGGDVSLADFYNWCTECTSGEYILKWDADLIAFEHFGIVTSMLDGKLDALFYPLIDLYGDHHHTRRNRFCGPEPYIFKRSIKHYCYHDGIERLPLWGELPTYVTSTMTEPLGLHMNIKSIRRYVLREIMREYRKYRPKDSLEQWAVTNYNLAIDELEMEAKMLKDIIPFEGPYPAILDSYLRNPKWEIVYANSVPTKRIERS